MTLIVKVKKMKNSMILKKKRKKFRRTKKIVMMMKMVGNIGMQSGMKRKKSRMMRCRIRYQLIQKF